MSTKQNRHLKWWQTFLAAQRGAARQLLLESCPFVCVMFVRPTVSHTCESPL